MCNTLVESKSPPLVGSLQDLTMKRGPFSPDSQNKTEITPFRGGIKQKVLVDAFVSGVKRKHGRWGRVIQLVKAREQV